MVRLGAIGKRSGICVFFLGVVLALSWNSSIYGDNPPSEPNPAPEVLLNDLNDAQYKVRREAFLKLCDNNLPLMIIW